MAVSSSSSYNASVGFEQGGTRGFVKSGASFEFEDSGLLNFGDSDDLAMRWDGTDFDILPLADDTILKIGNGTLSCDLWVYGDIPTAYLLWDASASELSANGPVRFTGLNGLSRRYELTWVAGAKGIPQLNAVTDPSAGDTYNTAGFIALLNADREFEILGNNASSDDVTLHAEGGIKFQTDGGGTDAVILVPHLNANQSAWSTITWGTDRETVWECDISTGSSIAGIVLWAGLKLTNTATTATDNDQAFFRYAPATNSGKWQAVYSISGTDTEGDSGVTVATSTRYHLKIAIDSSRIARFYINGALVSTSTALANTIDLIPYIGILESAAAARDLFIHGQAISRTTASA